MKETRSSYCRHRFPPEVISHAVWIYFRFSLSFRDVEDLLTERSGEVPYETIRRCCLRLGTQYARRLTTRYRPSDIRYLDEMLRIHGEQHSPRRAVDQEGDTIDTSVQNRRDAQAVKGFTCTTQASRASTLRVSLSGPPSCTGYGPALNARAPLN